jgi:hypothetical protein
MLVYMLLGVTFLFAFLAIWLAATRQTWTRLFLALAMGSAVYVYGTWIYLSIHAKPVFGVCLIMAAILGFLRKKKRASTPAAAITSIILGLLLSTLTVLYFTGSTGVPEKVELAFPLKTGKYFVLQGGKGLPANFFHYKYRGAIYAIDLVKLNKYGNRADWIFTPVLEEYEIFNDTVFSPCSGRIVSMHDDNPDNIPPLRERGPSNTNSVVIETDSFYVFLAHLRHNGVLVKEGQEVQTGQPLALVGNSGYSLEPHLHIQVHAKEKDKPWYRGRPLYISFDGKSYLLFETIRPKRVRMVDR